MAVTKSNRKAALASPATHRFQRGVGYLKFDKPPLNNPGASPPNLCSPPSGTKDSSLHQLRPPTGGPTQQFKWHVATRAWMPERYNLAFRMGFTDTYLSRAGWTYIGPV